MDYNKTIKERDHVVDIESGGSESEDDQRNEPLTGSRRVKSMIRSVGGTLTFEGSDEGECGGNSCRNSLKSSDDESDDIESLKFEKFGGRNGEQVPLTEEKHKNSKSRRAQKPPRPRKGPLLDTADLKLVKEISELVMKKRARVERLKALKKMRAAKSSSPSSSNNGIFAMVITVLFFIVIIFQGFGSGQSSTSSHDSPVPSGAATGGLISIQIGTKSNGFQQISKPPNLVEQTSGSTHLSSGA